MIKTNSIGLIALICLVLLFACHEKQDAAVVSLGDGEAYLQSATEILAVNDSVYFVSSKDSLYRVNTSNSTLRGFPLNGYVNALIVGQDKLFYVLEVPEGNKFHSIGAIDLQSGDPVWEQDNLPFQDLYGGMAMVVTDSALVCYNEEKLHTFSKNSGELLGSLPLDRVDSKKLPQVASWSAAHHYFIPEALLMGHKKVLLKADPDSVFIEKGKISGTGNGGWEITGQNRYEIVATRGENAIAYRTYTRDANQLRILDAGTGKQLFEHTLPTGARVSIQACHVAIHDPSEGVQVYNFRTGDLLYTTSEKNVLRVLIYRGRLVFINAEGDFKWVNISGISSSK